MYILSQYEQAGNTVDYTQMVRYTVTENKDYGFAAPLNLWRPGAGSFVTKITEPAYRSVLVNREDRVYDMNVKSASFDTAVSYFGPLPRDKVFRKRYKVFKQVNYDQDPTNALPDWDLQFMWQSGASAQTVACRVICDGVMTFSDV